MKGYCFCFFVFTLLVKSLYKVAGLDAVLSRSQKLQESYYCTQILFPVYFLLDLSIKH